jgi:hypothetical protein
MTLDTTQPRSRRALLAASIGALAASVAHALGRPAPARADDPDDVTLNAIKTTIGTTGIEIVANSSTVFQATTLNGIAVHGHATSGTGVYGDSNSSWGVYGASISGPAVTGEGTSGPGVTGSSFSVEGIVGTSEATSEPAILGQSHGGSTGVQGHSGANGSEPAPPANTGVYGYADQDATARGVVGQTTAGQGVRGLATTGIGVRGYATSGTAASFESGTYKALATSGRVVMHKISGVATLAANTTTVVVSPGVDVMSGAFVLVTPQGNPGARFLWATIDAAGNTLTIRTNVSAGTNLKAAWLLLG